MFKLFFLSLFVLFNSFSQDKYISYVVVKKDGPISIARKLLNKYCKQFYNDLSDSEKYKKALAYSKEMGIANETLKEGAVIQIPYPECAKNTAKDVSHSASDPNEKCESTLHQLKKPFFYTIKDTITLKDIGEKCDALDEEIYHYEASNPPHYTGTNVKNDEDLRWVSSVVVCLKDVCKNPNIPAKSTSTTAVNNKDERPSYVEIKGPKDTLYSITQEYDITPAQLMKFNKKNDYPWRIQVGDIIYLTDQNTSVSQENTNAKWSDWGHSCKEPIFKNKNRVAPRLIESKEKIKNITHFQFYLEGYSNMGTQYFWFSPVTYQNGVKGLGYTKVTKSENPKDYYSSVHNLVSTLSLTSLQSTIEVESKVAKERGKIVSGLSGKGKSLGFSVVGGYNVANSAKRKMRFKNGKSVQIPETEQLPLFSAHISLVGLKEVLTQKSKGFSLEYYNHIKTPVNPNIAIATGELGLFSSTACDSYWISQFDEMKKLIDYNGTTPFLGLSRDQYLKMATTYCTLIDLDGVEFKEQETLL